MLDLDLLELARGISSELYTVRECGQTPVAIVMDRATGTRLEEGNLGTRWRSGQPELFNLPVEIDMGAEGWAVRVR